jgi:hypothetical protein
MITGRVICELFLFFTPEVDSSPSDKGFVEQNAALKVMLANCLEDKQLRVLKFYIVFLPIIFSGKLNVEIVKGLSIELAKPMVFELFEVLVLRLLKTLVE